MNSKKVSLTYVALYLSIGGLGFVVHPEFILKVFFSTGDYGTIMPRLVGMFMLALGFLVYRIVSHNDWKYYLATIQLRSLIVVFLLWLFFLSGDLMFLVVNGIVLVGLLPSIWIHFWSTNDG